MHVLTPRLELGSVRTIVEVGSRDCVETLALAHAFPASHVYAFECNPSTLPTCKATVGHEPAITLVKQAVSDVNGSVDFYAIDQERTTTTWPDGNPGASSLLPASGKYPVEDYVQNRITVRSTRLDTFAHENSLQNIDILWMDIQGAELAALRGLGEKLQGVKAIHTEVEFFEIYSGQPLFWEVWRFLRNENFSLVAFTSFHRFAADAVFVHRSLIPSIHRPFAALREWLLVLQTLRCTRYSDIKRQVLGLEGATKSGE